MQKEKQKTDNGVEENERLIEPEREKEREWQQDE